MVKTRTKGQKSETLGNEARRTAPRTAGAISRRKLAYEIRLENHLQGHWAACFDGWTVTNIGIDEVVLVCSCTDHAGLHGALDKIRDLNLTLISVKRMPIDSSRSAADLESEDSKKSRRSK